jgi:quinol monooxygenase YgiN
VNGNDLLRDGVRAAYRQASSPTMGEGAMTAFNVVRFRVKPGRDQEFLDAHKKVEAAWPGMIHANIIKTGDRSYCIIAEWQDMDACIEARPNMIATLDSFRDTLEDLGAGLGVTDPAAGAVVLALK